MKYQTLTLSLLCLLVGCDARVGTAEEALRVQEALIRYQFTHNAAARKDEVKIFCVELVTGSGRADPPAELFWRFNNEARKVVNGSSCDRNQTRGVIEKLSGNPALVLVIGDVIWKSEHSAVVKGGYYEASLSASGNVYHLEKVDGVWSVTEDDMKWIS